MHTHTHTHSFSAAQASESPEAAMERHRRNQESIAEEMMSIARSLKDNALTAKNIIVNDNQVAILVCPVEIPCSDLPCCLATTGVEDDQCPG